MRSLLVSALVLVLPLVLSGCARSPFPPCEEVRSSPPLQTPTGKPELVCRDHGIFGNVCIWELDRPNPVYVTDGCQYRNYGYSPHGYGGYLGPYLGPPLVTVIHVN